MALSNSGGALISTALQALRQGLLGVTSVGGLQALQVCSISLPGPQRPIGAGPTWTQPQPQSHQCRGYQTGSRPPSVWDAAFAHSRVAQQNDVNFVLRVLPNRRAMAPRFTPHGLLILPHATGPLGFPAPIMNDAMAQAIAQQQKAAAAATGQQQQQAMAQHLVEEVSDDGEEEEDELGIPALEAVSGLC